MGLKKSSNRLIDYYIVIQKRLSLGHAFYSVLLPFNAFNAIHRQEKRKKNVLQTLQNGLSISIFISLIYISISLLPILLKVAEHLTIKCSKKPHM